MRRLAQPEVLKSAGVAALATSLACYPRLALWPQRLYPVWYMESIVFLGGIVLWAFVFAWHTEYTDRPVFTLEMEPAHFVAATAAGIFVATVLHLFLDPSLRPKTPEDYPASLGQWTAMTLFNLAFTKLFLVFAPFAWLIRLFQTRLPATLLTVLFGVVVLTVKTHSSPIPFSSSLFSALLVVRVILGYLSVYFYLRGGVLLAWWWSFVVEARYLLEPGSDR